MMRPSVLCVVVTLRKWPSSLSSHVRFDGEKGNDQAAKVPTRLSRLGRGSGGTAYMGLSRV